MRVRLPPQGSAGGLPFPRPAPQRHRHDSPVARGPGRAHLHRHPGAHPADALQRLLSPADAGERPTAGDREPVGDGERRREPSWAGLGPPAQRRLGRCGGGRVLLATTEAAGAVADY